MAPRRGPKKPRPLVGDTQNPDSITNHLQRYLAYLEERNYSAYTILNRDKSMRYFILWCCDRGITTPHELDRPTLERYQRHLFYLRKSNGEPLCASSQHQRIVAVRRFLQWMVKQRLLTYSPAAELELPRTPKRLPKSILSAREAEQVMEMPDLNTAVGIRDRAMLETFYSTGMRRMELIKLNLRDLDFDRGTVMIRQGKGKKYRMIPIGERALLWIAAYRDKVRPDFVEGRDEGTVFLTSTGEAFMPSHLSRVVAAYIGRANLKKLGSCHTFRHTAATLMLEGGADIRHIQALLGHASLETTEIYTRVSIRMLKQVHSATHPGRLPELVRERLEDEE